MILTERDEEILRFINEFGYCDIAQLMVRFELKKTWMYRLIERLINENLVRYCSVLNSRHRIYSLTNKGATFTDLPPIDGVTVGQYRHHAALIYVYLKLRKKYPDAEWISERRLLQEKFSNGLGKRGHVADGILHFTDSKKVAIEVEISVKAKHKVDKILRDYCTQLAVKEVWYYCARSVMPSLTALSAKMPFIKIFRLDDFLNAE
ncbi:MAG TPA: MarR family winged helix-turn-helix transcriptional regulator [Gammaproteobacteria bacterium]|nr:MarR family winged helix-turn-helix transcriptional regulator [Gammaproteobacteria bacterium]